MNAAQETIEDAIDRLIEVIEANQTFVVTSHEQPDGDAVGGTLSMGLLLKELGKDVTFLNVDAVPYNFKFLPGADFWSTEIGAKPQVTILLDCAERTRPGAHFPERGWGDIICVVDHHKTWDPEFADIYVRDAAAAATGELVFRIAKRLNVMTSGIAHNIYCCLLTDTGSFRYSNTSRTTFNIAGELVEEGVDPWYMTSHVYESQPRERVELLSKVLSTLEITAEGRLAFLRIEDGLLPEGASPSLIDGFINFARSIDGVEVATQMMSAGESWAISFRSRGNVDVSALAERFGGGGHHNAAGCRIEGSAEKVRVMLTEGLVQMLDGV